jgi:hypothetical protein
MIKPRSIAALLAAALSGAAYAGPPFITDDPEPVELHRWEINYGATMSRSDGLTTGATPGVDINYGAAQDTQLHIQPQLAYAHGQGANAVGMGDLELGVKYRFHTPESEDGGWMAGIYPMLELPTGSARRNLGAGAHSVYLPVWLQTTRGRWTVFGGGGYWIDSGADARNAWAGGVTALYQINQQLQFGGEMYGTTPHHENDPGVLAFNLGGSWQMREGLALLFSAGRGLRNVRATDQATAYLGLRTSF